MARRRFIFEVKIILSIVIAVVIVVIIGLFAYRSMSTIIVSIKKEANPDKKITVLKYIQSDISDAESSVKSYSITRDNEYLEPFYQAASSIDGKINTLYKLSADNKDQQQVIDSLKFFTEQKFLNLRDILSLQTDNRVDETLEKISDKLLEAEKAKKKFETKTASSIESKEEEPEERRSDIISRLFIRREKKQAPDTILNPKNEIRKQENYIEEVREEVDRMKAQELSQAYVMMGKQLEYTQKDKVIMDKIRACILRLEELERKVIFDKTQRAEQMANDANRIIATFCIAVSLLLLALGYVIISYTRKTGAYSKALKKAKREAENLARMKESFLSTMSHEIRTPMNAIFGFTEQLLDTPLRKEQKEQIEIIKKSADHLLCIINDVLDFSKLGAGKLELDNVGFKPQETIEDVICMMKPHAVEKNIQLSYFIDKGIPEVLVGDSVRLKQVLINIISNAIKFTNTGGVEINCIPILKNPKSVQLQITIKDTGIGIPAVKTHNIFNEFEQAETDITRKYGGTGLGLTITRKLLSLQNGTIQIISKEGEGTVVTFSVPYTIGSINDVPIPEKLDFIRNGSIHQETTILIADDEEYNRMLLTTIFKKWGVIYTEVNDGQEAIDELSKNKYDIVLMDVQMPVMDGIQATAYIRSHNLKSDNRHIPIMALLASTSSSTVEQCLEKGMNDVLYKPFKEKDLYDKMLLLLNKNFTNKNNVVVKEEPVAKSNEESVGYNLEEIYKMSDAKNEFVKEMIKLFIKATSEGIVAIKRGIKNNSWEYVAYQAHKISAPCKHIEAETLYGLLKKVESKVRMEHNTLHIDRLVQEMEVETKRLVEHLEVELSKIE